VRGVTDRQGPAERLVGRTLDERDLGRPLSDRARQSRRTVEEYLRAGARPRWMERLMEIEHGIKRERRRLARAHRALAAETRDDFAERWREIAHGWRFEALNELIGQHNDWYPIERDLPMDPRTRDYVRVGGRSYRRAPLDAAWILREFPPVRPPEEPDTEA
jgi:hypothetical protein